MIGCLRVLVIIRVTGCLWCVCRLIMVWVWAFDCCAGLLVVSWFLRFCVVVIGMLNSVVQLL